MMRIRFSSFAALLIGIMPTQMLATYSQGGYPAYCFAAAECNGTVCIGSDLPSDYITFVVFNDDGTYSAARSFTSEKRPLGYFNSLEQARGFIADNQDLGFSGVIIPNDNVSDAFGLDYYSVYSRGGNRFLSDNFASLICARTDEPEIEN